MRDVFVAGIGITSFTRLEYPLAEIAASVGLSEYHLQRVFSEWAGISPKRFLQYLLRGHVKMVGGLVHDHQVGRSGDHLCQGKSAFFTAGEYLHLFIHIIALKQKGAEQRSLLGNGHIIFSVGKGFQGSVLGCKLPGLMLAKIGGNNIVSGSDGAGIRCDQVCKQADKG